jgi:hypothetical protein
MGNDFWKAGKDQIETDKGYLYGVKITDKECNSFSNTVDYNLEKSFYLNTSKRRYALLQDRIVKEFFDNSESTDNRFIRLHFLFTDYPIENASQLENYKDKKHYFETFKWLEKSSQNSLINLKNNEEKSRNIYIKERIDRFIDMDILKFNTYVQEFGEEKLLEDLSKDKDFDLYYFDNYSKCLKSLADLIKNFQHLKIVEDTVLEEEIDTNTSMKVSEFAKRVYEKIQEDSKKQLSFSEEGNLSKFHADSFYDSDDIARQAIVMESRICDFYNLLVYVSGLRYSLSKSNLSTHYFPPIFIDNYDLKIVSGLEIKLKDENKDYLRYIEAFDDKGNKVNIRERDHYYIIQDRILFFTAEILKQLNIQEVKISTKKKSIKVFKVEEFLRN